MNDERLTELKEKYKDRNLLEELAWGVYYDHSGYTSKTNGEFLNWLCLMAYKALKEKERPQGEWVVKRLQNGFDDVYCPFCNARPTKSEYGYYLKDNFCHECGADMRKGGTE